MKSLKFVSMLLVAAVMLTGCDFFRSIMGKPTSKDLERMKIEAQRQAEAKRKQDSIDMAKAQEAARIAAAEAEARMLKERYYVVVGSFKVPGNADRLFEVIRKNGYGIRIIPMKNGFSMVAAASTDNYREALKIMSDVKEFVFCPEDVWVYDSAQGLHE